MKRFITLTVLFLLASATTVMAMENGLYMPISFSTTNDYTAGESRSVAVKPGGGLGYKLSERLYFEAKYQDLGDFKHHTDDHISVEIETETEINGADVSLIYSYPIFATLSLTASAGVYFWDMDRKKFGYDFRDTSHWDNGVWVVSNSWDRTVRQDFSDSGVSGVYGAGVLIDSMGVEFHLSWSRVGISDLDVDIYKLQMNIPF